MDEDHFKLVSEGLVLHEAHAYARALPHFERACAAAPACPVARYNCANTLHMLGRDVAAEAFLLPVIGASVEELSDGCPDCDPRSLKLDALFLLSQILRSGRRPDRWTEALALAEMHLRQRRRGVRSVWSARQVRAELAIMRAELAESPPARRAAASRDRIAKRVRRR